MELRENRLLRTMIKPGELRRIGVGRLLGMLLLLGMGAAAQADIVVVAGAKSPLTALTKEQVSDVYLARNPELVPMDLPEDNPLREEFYTKVTGKPAARVKGVWVRLAFTAKGKLPKEAPSAAELKKQLAATTNTIAYMDKADVDSSVKVLFAVQ